MPEELVGVLNRAVARDPAERYASVRGLATALAEVVGRPWGQAEISELVRGDFSDELNRHHNEVSGVVRRGSPRTMPIILESPSDPDAEEYSSFEASIENSATKVSQPGVIGKLRDRARGDWKAIAVGLGAAALVITVMSIVQARRAAPAGAARARVVAQAGGTAAYGDAIRAHDAALARCVAGQDAALPDGTRAVLRIGPDGHARQISFTPDEAERSAVVSCLRGVLSAAVFPTSKAETEIAIALRR